MARPDLRCAVQTALAWSVSKYESFSIPAGPPEGDGTVVSGFAFVSCLAGVRPRTGS